MFGFKTLAAAALLSVAAITSANAQLPTWAQSEPAAFEAQYPDRDILNGGELTPAGRMGLELPGGAAPAYGVGNVEKANAWTHIHRTFHSRHSGE
ncbi:MAG TPA: hypothetical protein VGH13_15165 [Xanthobacteraceae bacterium]|jgi:hypothetical protein